MANWFNFRILKDKIENLTDDKKRGIIVLFILIGLLMMLPNGINKMKIDKEIEKEGFNVQNYETELEERLLKIVEKVNGVGNAKIMVTLANSIEYIYAQEKREKSDKISDYQEDLKLKSQEKIDQENKLILIDGPNSKRQALIKTELQPQVKGVVVVCQGGDRSIVKVQLTNIITTLLNIPSSKVYVTKSYD